MNHWTAPRRADVAPWAVTQFPEHAEAWELNAMARQAADERAASKRWHDTYPMHGTEGCADTSDDSSELGEGGFIACALVVGCVGLALFAAYLQWRGA